MRTTRPGAPRRGLIALTALAAASCSPGPPAGTPGERPRLQAAVVDLGAIPHGRRVFATYVLENPEDKVLPVLGVVVSCACAYLNLKTIAPDGAIRPVDGGPRPAGEPLARVEPGGRLEAVVRYETAETPAIRATLNEPVAFYLDHARVPRLDARLAGSILPRLQVHPALLEFPQVPAGGTGTLVVDLAPLPGGSPFRVLGFKGLGDKLRAEILSEDQGRIRLRFSVGPGLEPGGLGLPVRVRTDLEGDYELPLLLGGRVVPDLQLEPAPPLPFGRIDPRQPARTSCLLTWHHPHRPLAPRVVEVEGAEGVGARLVELERGRLWRLELVSEPGPGGRAPGPLAGTVRLATNDPARPELRVPFQGSVGDQP